MFTIRNPNETKYNSYVYNHISRKNLISNGAMGKTAGCYQEQYIVSRYAFLKSYRVTLYVY